MGPSSSIKNNDIMLQLFFMVLLILTTFRPSPTEAEKSTNKPKRKHITEMEKAKAEVDYVLSIERAVERAEFRRLPDEEGLPKDPKLWPARAARERAQLERDIWVSELLPPNPGARPSALRASLNPSNPFHNISKTNAATLSKRLIEALDEEAIDPTLYDNYDDELKLVRDLKDRVGEKVLNSWRRRMRFRPPSNMLRYSLKPLQRLELPVMMTSAMRALLRRNERKLRQMPLTQPDTTLPWQPASPPHAPLPSPSRRNFEFDKWMDKFQNERPVLQPMSYTIHRKVSESWISKLWYYSTPNPARMKLWAFRKMQESVYHVQDWVADLDDILRRNENNIRFKICYNILVLETLLRDIRLFWTFLRHRFYLSTLIRRKKKKSQWGSNLFEIANFLVPPGPDPRYQQSASLNKIPIGVGPRGMLGAARSNDISRHLVYYTMAARRYIDLVGISEQIMYAYHNRLVKIHEERDKRWEVRKRRARTRTFITVWTDRLG